ncbi:hypothetical protein PTT_11592 [Pyrenophora teres f. teres 0-1]|uniref:DUF3328 domain containing protein n=1 Tax=Pyrenophora teres f. teres (strain 0-1) TaxID=861557 RepID=E3RRV3_PYRTT|nr:hypothetical protein PTT_11592 [Pyrenophora teres f. teres 0-1]
MAYARLSDHSPMEAPDEKDDLSIWPPRHLSRLFSYKTLFGASLALWIVTSATFGWVLAHRPCGYGNHAATLMPFPPVPSRVVAFEPNSKFHYTAKDAGGPAWSALMPNDGGILSVADPSKYQLPASYKDRNNSNAEVYSMSMFHQLHCLNSIRMQLGMLEGFINNTAADVHQRNVFAPESHVNHCFDYLRQAIMCAGDLSLEHSVVPSEFGFNGWGTSHKCADWSAMWDIAVDRRYDQSIAQQAGK